MSRMSEVIQRLQKVFQGTREPWKAEEKGSQCTNKFKIIMSTFGDQKTHSTFDAFHYVVKSHTIPFFLKQDSPLLQIIISQNAIFFLSLLLQKCVGKCQVLWLTHIKVCNHAGCESRDHTCTKQFANLHSSMTSGTKCLQDTPASDSPYCF